MDLHEAVSKASTDAESWAYEVLRGDAQFASATALTQIVLDASGDLGRQICEQIWLTRTYLSGEEIVSLLATRTHQATLTQCWTFFAMGWVMGSAQNQIRAANEPFCAVLASTPEGEVEALTARFAAEEFLTTRFCEQMSATSLLVSKIFASKKLPMTYENCVQWSSMTASVALYEAFELGSRSRTLIETDLALSQMEFE